MEWSVREKRKPGFFKGQTEVSTKMLKIGTQELVLDVLSLGSFFMKLRGYDDDDDGDYEMVASEDFEKSKLRVCVCVCWARWKDFRHNLHNAVGVIIIFIL